MNPVDVFKKLFRITKIVFMWPTLGYCDGEWAIMIHGKRIVLSVPKAGEE